MLRNRLERKQINIDMIGIKGKEIDNTILAIQKLLKK